MGPFDVVFAVIKEKSILDLEYILGQRDSVLPNFCGILKDCFGMKSFREIQISFFKTFSFIFRTFSILQDLNHVNLVSSSSELLNLHVEIPNLYRSVRDCQTGLLLSFTDFYSQAAAPISDCPHKIANFPYSIQCNWQTLARNRKYEFR